MINFQFILIVSVPQPRSHYKITEVCKRSVRSTRSFSEKIVFERGKLGALEVLVWQTWNLSLIVSVPQPRSHHKITEKVCKRSVCSTLGWGCAIARCRV